MKIKVWKMPLVFKIVKKQVELRAMIEVLRAFRIAILNRKEVSWVSFCLKG
jgi:hypothetical protein